MNLTHPSPIFALTVDGEDITVKIADRLSTLTLTDNRGFEADQLDIVLDDGDGKLTLPPLGAVIRLSLGWKATGLVDKGSYTVDDIEHEGAPDILTIRARSADLRSGLTTQRERSFHGKKVGDIVRTIAAENDLDPVIAAQLDTIAIEHLDQTNETSANLLTRMAGMFDAIATVKSGRLMFIHAGGGVTASGKPLPTITITRGEGDKHRFSLADRGNYTHVSASWHDIDSALKGEVIWSKAEDDAENSRSTAAPTESAGQYKDMGEVFKSRASAKRAAQKEWGRIKNIAAMRAKYVGVKAAYNDLNLNVSGTVSYGNANELQARQRASKLAVRDASVLASAQPQSAIEISADNIKVLRHPYASQTNARNAARTEWRRLQRGMAEFSITLAHGRPEIIPEQPAIVQGFKREIDSTDWTIARATHSLSDAGLTTRLEFEIKATEIPG